MAIKNQGVRVDPNIVGVEGARPYHPNGNRPDGAVPYMRPLHGGSEAPRPYVSDTPYVEPYADRATCAGTRTDGQPCKAKAKPGERFCAPHESQG